jgi:hypothetical protein
LLEAVDGKDVAAGEGTWRMQEDAVCQSAGAGACVVGNAKVAVVVENERGWVDERLEEGLELVLVGELREQQEALRLELAKSDRKIANATFGA